MKGDPHQEHSSFEKKGRNNQFLSKNKISSSRTKAEVLKEKRTEISHKSSNCFLHMLHGSDISYCLTFEVLFASVQVSEHN